MTTQQPSIPVVGLKWGVLTGLVFIVYYLVIYITESFGNVFINFFLSTVLAIAGIVLAMRDFRNSNGGYMTYGQGLLLGLVVMVVGTLLSGIFSYFYIEFVDPAIPEKMVDAAMVQLERLGADDELLDEQREKVLAESENTPLKVLKSALSNGVFGGLFLSLIIAAIMKRKRPEFE